MEKRGAGPLALRNFKTPKLGDASLFDVMQAVAAKPMTTTKIMLRRWRDTKPAWRGRRCERPSLGFCAGVGLRKLRAGSGW